MPVSQRQLVNYLGNFKVSELKELSKYFNNRVTRQNGGGSCTKNELIWNLVGGSSASHKAQTLAHGRAVECRNAVGSDVAWRRRACYKKNYVLVTNDREGTGAPPAADALEAIDQTPTSAIARHGARNYSTLSKAEWDATEAARDTAAATVQGEGKSVAERHRELLHREHADETGADRLTRFREDVRRRRPDGQ